MMLIKLFLFFLLLLILPDMYIYKAYIRRVSQKWTHWAYWLPSLFLLLTRVRDKDCVKNRVKRAKIVRFTLC